MSFIILDIETNGLSIYYAEPCEIGAIEVDNDLNIIDTFQRITKVTDLQRFKSTQDIHKISEDEMQAGINPVKAVSELNNFIGDKLVVGHNIVNFDFPILKRYNLKFIPKFLDTLLALRYIGELEKYGLGFLRDNYKINITPHRAVNDCKILLEVIKNNSMLKARVLENV